ncbi:hypothetical protein V8C86DRAFT_370969 [Haematococcus lacustris]
MVMFRQPSFRNWSRSVAVARFLPRFALMPQPILNQTVARRAAVARLLSKKMAEQPQLSQIIASTANTGVSDVSWIAIDFHVAPSTQLKSWPPAHVCSQACPALPSADSGRTLQPVPTASCCPPQYYGSAHEPKSTPAMSKCWRWCCAASAWGSFSRCAAHQAQGAPCLFITHTWLHAGGRAARACPEATLLPQCAPDGKGIVFLSFMPNP